MRVNDPAESPLALFEASRCSLCPIGPLASARHRQRGTGMAGSANWENSGSPCLMRSEDIKRKISHVGATSMQTTMPKVSLHFDSRVCGGQAGLRHLCASMPSCLAAEFHVQAVNAVHWPGVAAAEHHMASAELTHSEEQTALLGHAQPL